MITFQSDIFELFRVFVRMNANLCFYKVQVRVPTTGKELRPDGGNELTLKRLGVGTLGVLDCNVPVFDPTQQPQKVAVT